MTVRELKHKVYSLAHLPVSDTDLLFGMALKLALDKIRTELLISEEIKIYIPPCRPSVKYPALIHYSGEKKSLPLTGRAYSLSVSGKGHFTVRDGYDCIRYDFDTEMSRFRGFINTGGEICFEGDYTYTVLDFACYSDIMSNREEDIPDGSEQRYINLADKGVLKLLTHPTDCFGKNIDGARIVGTMLCLPSDFYGAVCFEAIRLSKECGSDEDKVDIPDRYFSLLPPLVAALLFSDDDEELAAKCEKMYENLKKELNLIEQPHASISVQTNGWA